ncbi:MAG: hypothetical protein D6791_00375 [Chloroflexi bacterium]|nr:MAG: hypothetical protein D6791_00375 [Chloroflexota bacterium]
MPIRFRLSSPEPEEDPLEKMIALLRSMEVNSGVRLYPMIKALEQGAPPANVGAEIGHLYRQYVTAVQELQADKQVLIDALEELRAEQRAWIRDPLHEEIRTLKKELVAAKDRLWDMKHERDKAQSEQQACERRLAEAQAQHARVVDRLQQEIAALRHMVARQHLKLQRLSGLAGSEEA